MALTSTWGELLLTTPSTNIGGIILVLCGVQWARVGVTWPIVAACTPLTLTGQIPVPGLANSLATVHPAVTIAAYAGLLGLLFTPRPFTQATQIIFILGITITLGGWWAFQELTWGGWWNWDTIEVPVAALGLFALYVLYHRTRPRCTPTSFRSLHIALLVVILSARYAPSQSVHAFIPSPDNYTFYTTLALLPQLFGRACNMLATPTSFTFLKQLGFFWIISVVHGARERTLATSMLRSITRLSRVTHCTCMVLALCTFTLTWNYFGITTHSPLTELRFGTWTKPKTTVQTPYLTHLIYLAN